MSRDTNKLFKDDSEILFYNCDIDEVFYHNLQHNILFELPMRPANFTPHQSADKWDSDHVRMPFSPESKYVEILDDNKKNIEQRWDLIEQSLLRNFTTTHELEQAIKTYNSRYESIWKFDTLHEFVNQQDPAQRSKFFQKTLPDMVRLALRLPHLIKSPIPLLKQGMNKSISMSQEQAASILANGFFCTFPRRNTTKKNAEYSNYPNINFNKLFNGNGQNVVEKIKCIINYFERVTDKMPKGVVTFTRRFIDQLPAWKDDSKTFSNIKYTITSKYKIENACEMLQVDFSNKSIGGGILGNGCVQEEIRFCLNPELIVARLFTEFLSDEESFVMIGTEQFSEYSGYASTFRFAGNLIDLTSLDEHCRRKTRIVAIDALRYKNYQEQFSEANLIRELNKAYIGFYKESQNNQQPVATGFWGSGAFCGHPIKSALIQLLACRLNRRNLLFFTFNDNEMKSCLESLFECLIYHSVTTSDIFMILRKFYSFANGNNPDDLVTFIKNEVKVPQSLSNSGSKLKMQGLNFNLKKLTPSTSKPQQSPSFCDFREVKSECDFKFQRFEDKKYSCDKDKRQFELARMNFFDFPVKEKCSKKPEKSEEKKPVRSSLLDALNDDFK